METINAELNQYSAHVSMQATIVSVMSTSAGSLSKRESTLCVTAMYCFLQQLASVLKGRLTLKNAHKQWLALELVQEVSHLLLLMLLFLYAVLKIKMQPVDTRNGQWNLGSCCHELC